MAQLVQRQSWRGEVGRKESAKEFEEILSRQATWTHTSPLSLGPKALSYNPPLVGMFKLSNRIGLVICLTETSLISLEERKEKEMEVGWEGREWEMSMVGS